jgi:hypothetical protein
MTRMYGDSSSDDSTIEKLLGKKTERELVAEICKAAGVPYDRIATSNSLEAIIEKGINEALAKAGVSRAPGREGIMPRSSERHHAGIGNKFIRTLADRAAADDPSSQLTRFLKSYAEGDESGMRVVAREVAVEDAA